MDNFRAIAIDPPWHEPGGNGKGSDDHYETLRSPADIVRVVLTSGVWRPCVDCHLYLWTTMTSLIDGLWVMGALGFEYKTHVVWVKSKRGEVDADPEPLMGTGQYFRGAHELVLFGTRGRGFDVRTGNKSIPSVLVAPVERRADGQRWHSRKPPAFYEMVEQRSHGPWLDMFARGRREGWTTWGHEADGGQCDPSVKHTHPRQDHGGDGPCAACEPKMDLEVPPPKKTSRRTRRDNDDEAPPWAK